jgi:hypothetical protein
MVLSSKVEDGKKSADEQARGINLATRAPLSASIGSRRRVQN